MKFPSMPVRSGRDATLNFDKLQRILTERENAPAMAYRSGVQGIPNATFTLVKVDKAVKDAGNNFDLTKGYYVARYEGYYHADGQVFFDGAYVNNLALLFVNEAEQARGMQAALNTSVCSAVVFCKPGDHIELWCYQEGGVEHKLNLAAGRNYLHVMRAD